MSAYLEPFASSQRLNYSPVSLKLYCLGKLDESGLVKIQTGETDVFYSLDYLFL